MPRRRRKQKNMIKRRNPKQRNKSKLPSQTQSNDSISFCQMIMDQTDLVRHILSFLRLPSLRYPEQYNHYLDMIEEYHSEYSRMNNISCYMRHAMRSRGFIDDDTYFHTFNVLPVSFRTVNKIFNQVVTKLSHIIVSIQTELDLNILSLSPQCNTLKELYLIHCMHSDGKTLKDRSNALSVLKCPHLEILQIHYHNNCDHPFNVSLSKENLPKLEYLILGTAHNDDMRIMNINEVNLDLNIKELRMQYCNIKCLDSLRFSLARCTEIETLFLLFPDMITTKVVLHSLCMPSVVEIFILSQTMPEFRIYAPNLQVIQFYFCDVLDKLILLTRMPNELIKYMNCGDISTTQETDAVLPMIGFDNCREVLFQRHIPNFTIIKDEKRINDEYHIKWKILLWPFDNF
eukprot:32286_1